MRFQVRIILIFALLALPCAAQQSGYLWPPVDAIVSLNGQTIGSAVSNTTLASGMLGTHGSITNCPNNSSTMSVGANVAPLGAALQVLGSSTIYPASTAWPAIYYNDAVALQTCIINITTSTRVTVAMLHAFGPQAANPSAGDYDEIVQYDNSATGGNLFTVAQLQNGNCPASAYGESAALYGIELETFSNSTQHTDNCVFIHPPYVISSVSQSGTTATYTTSVAHGFTIGEPVFITGVGVSGYNTATNGPIVVSGCDSQTTPGYICTSTTFTATLSASGLASSSGGTVTPIYIENIQVDGPNNLVSEALFNDFPPYAQVGNTITAIFCGTNHCPSGSLPTSGWGIIKVQFGNNEAQHDGGTAVFQYLMIQYTNAQFPLVPQLWNGVLSPQRAADWTQAGVVGGIPSASWTVCQTLGTAGQSPTFVQSVTAANINSALSACDATPNSVVFLNAGTYPNLGQITFPTSATSEALRGAGADKTLLQFTSNAGCNGILSHICAQGSANGSGTPANLTTWITGTKPGPVGYGQGSNFVNLTAVTGTGHTSLKVGNPIILDQCDSGMTGDPCTGTITDNGSFFVTTSTSTGNATGTGLTGPYSVSGNTGNAERVNRSQQQIVTVTQCDGVTTPGHTCASGTNIGISPGIYAANWNAGQTPEAWWSSAPASYVGVEDLSEDSSGDSTAFPGVDGVTFMNCSDCWVMGVRSIETGYAHLQTWWSDHVTSTSNYLYLTKYWTSQGYGLSQQTCNNCLWENNIIQGVTSPMINSGACGGSVFGYNYAILDFFQSTTYNVNSHGDHTAGTDYCLEEGNIGGLFLADLIHGTHNVNTSFRSRWSATMPVCWVSSTNTSTPDLAMSTGTFGACTFFGNAIALDPFSRGYNIVGDVLGNGTWSPFNTSYKNTTTENNYAIYRLGAGYDGIPTDPNVPAMTLLYGNVDVQNNGSLAVEKSFCGNSSNTGWNSTVTGYRNCSATSEIPTALTGAQYPYYSYVPQFGDTGAGQNGLPASLYYTAKPSWWPASKAWPIIGPDVSSGNIAGTGGFANTNPAEDCYLNVMGGPANGVGPVLTFSRAACYSGSSLYTITVSSIVGSGTVTSSDSVINCTTGTTGTCSDLTATGTVTLTATPASGWSFSGWSGGTCSGSSTTCSVSAAATVTATFTLSTYTITVSSITGSGTVTSSDSTINCTTGTTGTCSDSTASGTVTLTATPASGWSFTSWGGGTCSGSSTTCSVSSGATVTATFTLTIYTITVSSITGSGTVTSSDSVLNCTTGTTGTCSDTTASGTVTLTATPASGWSFSGWGGGTCSGSLTTCSVSSGATVTATFTTVTAVSVGTVKSVGTASMGNQQVLPVYAPHFPNATSSTLAQSKFAGCNSNITNSSFCGTASTTYSVSSGVVTVSVSNSFGPITGSNVVPLQVNGCTNATFLNGNILLANSSTTTSAVVGTLVNTHNVAIVPGNSSGSDTTCYLQGQGWQPFVLAPFPAVFASNTNCPAGNGSPGCTASTTSSPSVINSWAYDFSVPGASSPIPTVPIVQVSDLTLHSGNSMVISISGESNDLQISWPDLLGGYFFNLVQGGSSFMSHGHLDPTYCGGNACFIADVTTSSGLAHVTTGGGGSGFQRNPTLLPGNDQATYYSVDLTNPYAPALLKYSPTYSAGAVSLGTPTTVYNLNTCPDFGHLTIGPYTSSLANAAQFRVDNFDNHVAFGLGSGPQGSLGKNMQFYISLTSATCATWNTAGMTGTNLFQADATKNHTGSGFNPGDTVTFNEGVGVCSSTLTVSSTGAGGSVADLLSVNTTLTGAVSSIGTSVTVGVASVAGIYVGQTVFVGGVADNVIVTAVGSSTITGIFNAKHASGATVQSTMLNNNGCYLQQGVTIASTSGSGTGLEVDIDGIGTPGYSKVYPPIASTSCPAGNNTTLSCESAVTPSVAAFVTLSNPGGGVAPYGMHSGNMEQSGTYVYNSGHGTSWQSGLCTSACGYMTWNPATSVLYTSTALAAGHPAISYLQQGQASFPNYFSLTYPNGYSCPSLGGPTCSILFTYPNACLTNPGGSDNHSAWPSPANNLVNPILISSTYNSTFTRKNPPGWTCGLMSSLWALNQTGSSSWFAKWYDNSNNQNENFEGPDSIFVSSPDEAFVLGVTDHNSGLPGNAGLGTSTDSGTPPFVAVFSYTLGLQPN